MAEAEIANAKTPAALGVHGVLDWPVPTFAAGATDAAMGVDVTTFFTFCGLS